jgi:UDP-N-acetylmuramoyl-tripeptide--D-alanyl-D-alanine ligase
MGTVEAVAKAKGELFGRIPAGGFAVYNADDPLISRCCSSEGVTRISFGLGTADVGAERIEPQGTLGQRFVLRLPSQKVVVSLGAFGVHNVYNALAAAAAAFALDVASEDISAGLEAFTPYDKRFNLEVLNGITIIDDSYNANPGSVGAALRTLREIKGSSRAIAVLGDMLELGDSSYDSHVEIGRVAAGCVQRLYAVGEMAHATVLGATEGGLPACCSKTGRSHEDILGDLLDEVRDGDYVLVKGSRGMKMEAVAEAIRNARVSGGTKGAGA